MPLENLDGGGLAGPVGPEQGEHFADLDIEVKTIDGAVGSVGLPEAPDIYRGHAIEPAGPGRFAGRPSDGQPLSTVRWTAA
ncbi:hypothetical protein Ahu01nite_051140 [Winogradskya humida]|uniref:Uncharacterized protein n=1 Tax=Winogradskya humida TaxID=113566 RepID=A0ABQ3ZV30_9ACTN|nr:hypothetical protein Ahu01nite_051140 [Actinoplanes humidus]